MTSGASYDLTKASPLEAAVILSVVEIFADFSLKDPKGGLVLGLAGYNALALLLKKLLKHNDIGRVNIAWNSITNVSHLWLGNLWYGEKLTDYEMIGVALIMTGMGLLYLSKK